MVLLRMHTLHDRDGHVIVHGPDHPIHQEADSLRWAEEDEQRYALALLYAGAEPEDGYDIVHWDGETRYYPTPEFQEAHMEWQRKLAEVLMRKYYRQWWYRWKERETGSPEYMRRAAEIARRIQADELKKFYTWLCTERREPWTQKQPLKK